MFINFHFANFTKVGLTLPVLQREVADGAKKGRNIHLAVSCHRNDGKVILAGIRFGTTKN